jgi:hypothetical protein
MSEDSTPGEAVPWILKHAAARRGDVAETNGHSDAQTDDAPAEDAPASKFRRVSGAAVPPALATTPVRSSAGSAPRPATAAGRYIPPPPPPPIDWDAEVENTFQIDTYRPSPRSLAPPPSRPAPAPAPSGYSPYSPVPARRKSGGGMIAAMVAGAVILCGGGVGGGLLLAKGGAPSRGEFVSKADDLCRPANGPVAAIVKPTSYPELATAAGTLNTTIDAQLGQLRALKQPGGSAKSDVGAVFASLEGTSAAAKRLQDAAGRQDDAATIAATKDMSTTAGAARTKATTTGFAACSIGMQTGIDAVYGGTQSVMKTGFVAQADVLRRRAADDIYGDVDFDADLTDPAAFVAFITHGNDVFEQLVTDIKGLPVPPGDEATLAELFAAQDKVDAKSHEFEDAAGSDDFDRLDALDRELTTLTTAADAKWDAYGLGTCGSNFGF